MDYYYVLRLYPPPSLWLWHTHTHIHTRVHTQSNIHTYTYYNACTHKHKLPCLTFTVPSSAFSFAVGITLDDEYAQQMAEVVSYLNQNATGRSHLDMTFREAEKSGEGRSDILKSMWNEATEKAAFFKDQQKNSEWWIVSVSACKAFRIRSS